MKGVGTGCCAWKQAESPNSCPPCKIADNKPSVFPSFLTPSPFPPPLPPRPPPPAPPPHTHTNLNFYHKFDGTNLPVTLLILVGDLTFDYPDLQAQPSILLLPNHVVLLSFLFEPRFQFIWNIHCQAFIIDFSSNDVSVQIW